MEKITKTSFIELLCNNTTAMIVLKKGQHLTDSDKEIIRKITSVNANENGIEPLWRTVERKQTNAVMFSNGSWLYFDQKSKRTYWKCGNTILQVEEYEPDYVITCGYLIK